MVRRGDRLARLIDDGWVRAFDTGLINGQSFLLMASAGVDADVVRRLDAVRTGNIHHLSYVRHIYKAIRHYDYPQLSVYDEDGQLQGQGTHVIATNIPQYGFGIPFAPAADPFDGLLDVRIFQGRGTLSTAWHAVRTRLHAGDRAKEVTRFSARRLRIEADRPEAPCQCDGDPAAACPVDIQVVPASMTLMVPSS